MVQRAKTETFWDRATETMPRRDLEQLQMSRVRSCLKRLQASGIQYYCERLDEVRPDQIRSVEDLERLPFMVKDDLCEHYPFGLFLVPQSKILRIHASSGSTGKPTVVGYTRSNLESWANALARGLVAGGLTGDDTFQNAYGYGLFTGGLGFHGAAPQLGTAALPTSVGKTSQQVMLMHDFGVTAFGATPSYALHLAEVTTEEGIDLHSLPVRAAFLDAEPTTEKMATKIEEKMGIEVYEQYGLSEIIGPGVASACGRSEGMHIWEDHFIPEIVEPETGEPLADGEVGELVLTAPTKEALPVIRYRTRDLARLYREPCPCCRTGARISRILGRTDDMLIVRGVNVFPSQIEHALLDIEGLEPRYQLVLSTREDHQDNLRVQVEVSDRFAKEPDARAEVESHAQYALQNNLSLNATVELTEHYPAQPGQGRPRPGRADGHWTTAAVVPIKTHERQAAMSTVREITYELLRSFGITKVFGNPGSTEMSFLEGFPDDFTYVLGLHEGTVVGMADGYAQGMGQAAFVNLHTAAGLGNAGAAIMTAHHNRTPLVITAGQQDRRQLTYEPFLSGRLVEMALPYVKWSHQPARAEDVPAAIERAYHTAMQAPRGPAFVSIPMNDWGAETEPVEAREIDYRTSPNPEALGRAARALEASRRPALVSGAGVDRAGAWYDVVALAERLNAAVWADPMHPRAGFPQDHPLFQGVLPPAQASIAQQLSGYDVVLVLGAPVFRYFQYLPGSPVEQGTRVIHVTDSPDEASRAATGTGIMGDVALAVRQLIERLPKGVARPAPPPPSTAPAPEAKEPLPADYVLYILSRHLPDRAIIVEETPSSRNLLHKHIPVKEPGGFYAAASGGLGFGASASVGLKLASPDRPVACVVGEGSLMYAPQALWSASRYRVPVVYIVMNNGQYKILRLLAELGGLNKQSVPGLDILGLDIIGLARSLGCEGETVKRPEELPQAFKRAFRVGRPYVVEVLVDPSVPTTLA